MGRVTGNDALTAARDSPGGPAPRSVPRAVEATVAIVALACILASVTFRMSDPDLWQHLVVGRAIWSLGHIPSHELWVWPTYGEPAVTPSWLFRAMLWPFWSLGGVGGLFAWRWIVTLATFALLWRTARAAGARGLAVFPVLVLAGLTWRLRTMVRPETLVGVVLAAQMLVHVRVRSGQRAAAVALPALALVWANAHVSYWMGLALQGLFLADAWWRQRGATGVPRDTPRLAAALAASVAVSFLNPGGWRALIQPFEYAFLHRQDPLFSTISELMPPSLRLGPTNTFPLLAAGWPLLALRRIRRRGMDVAELGACALFLALALSSMRFTGQYALVAAPFMARDLTESLGDRAAAPAWPWPSAVACAALCATMCMAEWRSGEWPFGIGLQSQWYPVHACDYMEAHGVRGRGFNRFYHGGYLLWRFWPQRDRLPFMDIHQSGTPEGRALYSATLLNPQAWGALEARYGFDWVLVNRFRLMDTRLADALDADPRFALVFLDDTAALYLRRDGPLAGLAGRDAYRMLPAGWGRLDAVRTRASFDPVVRAALRAELERVAGSSPVNSGALVLLGGLDLEEGRAADAWARDSSAAARDPQAAFAFDGLARSALALGRPRAALAAIPRARANFGDPAELASLERRARADLAEIERGIAAAPRGTPARRSLEQRLAGLPRALASGSLPRRPADER